MRLSRLSLVAIVSAGVVSAQPEYISDQCYALYNDIVADVPVDRSTCMPIEPTYELTTCEPPFQFEGGLPTSHLILAIDASGSMAGQIGGESKMVIAKREALDFLQSVDDNISVGLVVYGHLGNNQEAGRAESCGSSEMIHGFDTNRRALAETIQGLSPTGWTPIGGVLEYAGGIISQLPADDDALVPVIYLISDGEETCNGDPVAVAQDLFEVGVRTTVNTIGFAVDPETQAQLEAVAEAGGGTFYPAENGNILRERLREIATAQASEILYEKCITGNGNYILSLYQDALGTARLCANANDPVKLRTTVWAAVRNAAPDDSLILECERSLNRYASDQISERRGWVSDVYYPFQTLGTVQSDAYMIENGFPPRFAKDE